MSRAVQVALVVLLIAITFFLAALQIPHIGEGAPDWHTVQNPQIPVQSVPDTSPKPDALKDADGLSSYACRTHPPIILNITQAVCVTEPVFGWRWDSSKKDWIYTEVAKKTSTKYLTTPVAAYWIDTLHCYAFYDNYNRLRLLPDFKGKEVDVVSPSVSASLKKFAH